MTFDTDMVETLVVSHGMVALVVMDLSGMVFFGLHNISLFIFVLLYKDIVKESKFFTEI